MGAAVWQRAEVVPILINKPATPIITIETRGIESIAAFHLAIMDTTGLDKTEMLSILPGRHRGHLGGTPAVAQSAPAGRNFVLRCRRPVPGSKAEFTVFIKMKPDTDLLGRVGVSLVGVEDATGRLVRPSGPSNTVVQRLGVSVMDADEVKGARIPGIATTRRGTLLAIYDARYESSRDLQGHMDIGLSRSTDGGQTWEPMRRVIDMGKWGGLPERYNGVSDACILVDERTDRIFVAGLWMHGVKDSSGKWIGAKGWNHQWRTGGSMPGFDPKETSQFMMVESSDDGVTWSEPRNLTKMLKDPEWHLFAPAPGRGITMRNGTLAMPTQGRDRDGTPFSNITYSTDRGRTWTVSAPASRNTTESQVVELADGSLMLNIRDNRNRGAKRLGEAGRSVYVTKDMGETWAEHPTSRKALPEPVCCAGFLAHGPDGLLVFSNPPNLRSKGGRTRMTMKFSIDQGETWPEKYHVLLDSGKSAYSCLTSVDEDTVGILYEGSRARICFQKVRVADLPVTRVLRAPTR
ncbi:MAG: sialidase family protein [Planctomycetota bacterium]